MTAHDDSQPGPRVLTARQVRELLSWPELIEATRAALVALAVPGGAPAGSSTQVAVPGASLHLKAGALLHPPILSVKANLRPDKGSASGAILAFDHQAQRLAAIIASADITAMRTGAIAAVAADLLQPDPHPVVALIGAGPVARMTLRALQQVREPVEVRVWSRHHDRAQEIVRQDGAIRAVDRIADATRGANLVITCTPSREPLVVSGDLDGCTVVLAMGADSPGKRELGPGVLDRATIFVDVLADALAVGECAYLTPERADITSLGEAVNRRPAPSTELTVFDSVGSSTVDAAAVALLLERAEAGNVGSALDLN